MTVDAKHLAVCVQDVAEYAGSDGIALVTRDHDQATAARALGLEVL